MSLVRSAALAGGAISMLLVPSLSRAVDVGATAELGVGRTDNIARTDTNPIDEDIVTGGLLLTLTEESRNVQADILARAVRYMYQDNTFDDETLGTVNGQVLFTSDNGGFGWLIQDTYGQQIIDVFRPITPNNRENVNVFTTGPDFRIPAGQQNSVVFNLRYTDIAYEVRPQDNDRRSATVQLRRQSTPNRAIALFVTGDDIRYDDQTVNFDLDRLQAFGRLDVTSPRTNMTLDIGWVEIESDITESDGLLAALTLNRQVSPSATLGIAGGTRFSEAGDIFSEFQGPGDRGVGVFDNDATADVENTSDPFRLNYANIDYFYETGRTTFGVGGGWRDEDYEVRDDLNRSLTNINVNVQRRLSTRFRVQAYVRFGKRDFETIGQEDDDLELGALFGLDVGRRLSFNLEATRFERDSNVQAASFKENRFFLTVQYRLLLTAADQ